MPCGRTSPGCGSGCRRRISACSSATSPATGSAPPPRAARDRPEDRPAPVRGPALGAARPRHRGQRQDDGPVRPDRAGRPDSRGGGRLADQRHRAAADVTAATDPLLRGLLDTGLARPDPLRLGIEADARGALLDVSGRPSESIFTLGPPLRGQLYETTAIPEIRDQAAALAGQLLAACRARAAALAASGLSGMAGSAA